jgi:hypothetical protein
LLATLREIEAAGEKAIIFSEFRQIQRLLCHEIEQCSVSHRTSSTAMRQPR